MAQPFASQSTARTTAFVPAPSAQAAQAMPVVRRAIAQTQTEDVCPITRESAQELGEDAFISRSEPSRLYSGPALRDWLAISGNQRARKGQQPYYLSPLTRRDMAVDAAALGLPKVPKLSVAERAMGAAERMVAMMNQHRIFLGIAVGLNMVSVACGAYTLGSRVSNHWTLLENVPNYRDSSYASANQRSIEHWAVLTVLFAVMTGLTFANFLLRGRQR